MCPLILLCLLYMSKSSEFRSQKEAGCQLFAGMMNHRIIELRSFIFIALLPEFFTHAAKRAAGIIARDDDLN